MDNIKPICFEHKGREYTLEFTRSTVRQLERSGFNFNDIETKQIDSICTLFAGAFLAHHRLVKQDVIDEIFEKMTNKLALFERLGALYMLPYQELTEEGNDEKNVIKWE